MSPEKRVGPAFMEGSKMVVEMVQRAFRPLASRKVRVALVTVIAAYAAEYGLGVSEEVVLTLVSVGVALILGIAHEDAGRLSGQNADPAPETGDGGE